MVFFLAAAIYALGGIIFIIFARGELEPWAVDATTTSPDVKNVEAQHLTHMPNGDDVKKEPWNDGGAESYTKVSHA